MAQGRVGHHHLVTALVVLKKIINTFLLHQPAREIEICLSVLDAVLPGLILATKLQVIVKSSQHFFEDVRDGFLLENTALRPAGEEPDLGDDFRRVTREFLVAITLREASANATYVPPVGRTIIAGSGHPETDLVPHQLAE